MHMYRGQLGSEIDNALLLTPLYCVAGSPP